MPLCLGCLSTTVSLLPACMKGWGGSRAEFVVQPPTGNFILQLNGLQVVFEVIYLK